MVHQCGTQTCSFWCCQVFKLGVNRGADHPQEQPVWCCNVSQASWCNQCIAQLLFRRTELMGYSDLCCLTYTNLTAALCHLRGRSSWTTNSKQPNTATTIYFGIYALVTSLFTITAIWQEERLDISRRMTGWKTHLGAEAALRTKPQHSTPVQSTPRGELVLPIIL